MSRKIIYIYNPISGTKRKDPLHKKIEKATKLKNIYFEFMVASPEGDYELLKRKIEHEKITDVVITGGDGTISKLTGSLRNCNVKLELYRPAAAMDYCFGLIRP